MDLPAHLARFELPFTEDQLALYDAVRRFARERCAPGAPERDRSHQFPSELVNEMAEMGLMGLKVPEDNGGPDIDSVAYLLVMEALGRHDATCAVIVAASNLSAVVLAQVATDAQKERWLRPLAEGERGAMSFCLSEPHCGSDASAMKTTATRVDGGWRIDGSKMWITSGAHAGLYLVFAKTDPDAGARGVSAFVVEAGAKGLEPGKAERKMGQRASGTVGLHLDGVVVGDDAMIGAPGEGYRAALRGLTAGRVGIAGLSLGIGEAAMEEGLRYVSEREAFGTRIADFQHTRFVLADCRTQMDAAWLLALRAARRLDAGHEARSESSMAKVFATETVDQVVDRVLQLHGGYGYSEEYLIERLYRDHRVTRIYEGSSEVQRMLIARELLGR